MLPVDEQQTFQGLIISTHRHGIVRFGVSKDRSIRTQFGWLGISR